MARAPINRSFLCMEATYHAITKQGVLLWCVGATASFNQSECSTLIHLTFLSQAIHKAVTVGGVDDKRSDSEDDPSEDENYNQVKKES